MVFVKLKEPSRINAQERDAGMPVTFLITLATIFLLALSARLWFSFLDGHETIANSCDAAEYIREAQALQTVLERPPDFWLLALKALLGLAGAEQQAQLHAGFAPLAEMARQAGPTFPAFILASCLITGNPVGIDFIFAPVLFQCIVTSLTCVLVAYVATRCWSLQAGAIAGLLAAFYPGFVVNSMRLYSESFACFCLCVVVALLVQFAGPGGLNLKSKLSPAIAAVAGFMLAVLQLTRSLLILVTGAALVFLTGLCRQSGWKRSMLALLAGFSLVIVVAMSLQWLTLGKSSVVTDRLGNYNLFVGLDLSTQGWLAYPYSDGSEIDGKSYTELIGESIEESPERFVKLLYDKPLRLFKFHWNDFRTPIGPFDQFPQVLYHQFCLLMAFLGLVLGLFKKHEAVGERENPAIAMRLFLVSLFAIHLVYIFFSTVPRYGLTAMPFVIVFSGVGLSTLIGLLASRSSRFRAVVLIIASAALFVGCRFSTAPHLIGPLGLTYDSAMVLEVFLKGLLATGFLLCVLVSTRALTTGERLPARVVTLVAGLTLMPFLILPIRAHGRTGEWAVDMNSHGDGIKQTIILPTGRESELAKRVFFVLVDCPNWQTLGQSLSVEVNGSQLSSPMIPIMPLCQPLDDFKVKWGNRLYYEYEDIYSIVLASTGGGNLDLRQWFALPVPDELVWQALRSETRALNIELKPSSRIGTRLFGAYGAGERVKLPTIARYSRDKALYGVENYGGLTDSRFDEHYKIGTLKHSDADLSSRPGIQSGGYNIRLLTAPSTLLNRQGGHSEPVIVEESFSGPVKCDRMYKCQTNQLPEYDRDSVWAVTVEMVLSSSYERTLVLPVQVDALVVSKGKSGDGDNQYVSPWVPSSLMVARGVNRMRFTYPVKPNAFPGVISQVMTRVSYGGRALGNQVFGTNTLNRKLGINVSEQSLRSVAESQIRLTDLKMKLVELEGLPVGNGFELF